MKRNKEQNQDIHQMMDKFYKEILSYKDCLEEFLRLFFPSVAKNLNFKKIKKINSSFVNNQFKNKEADLIFSIPLEGKNALIYILLEHQSSASDSMALRLHEYMSCLWIDLVKRKEEKATKLPVIIPIVLYNGTQKWTLPTKFDKTFKPLPKGSSLSKFIPHYEYLLFNLNETPMEFLLKKHELVTAPLILDKSRKSIKKAINYFVSKVYSKYHGKEINKEKFFNILQLSLDYILYHENIAAEQLVMDFIETINEEELKKEIEHMAQSTALKLINQGRKQGIEQGMEKGMEKGMEQGMHKERIEIAKKMKVAGSDVELIAKFTGLDIETIRKL